MFSTNWQLYLHRKRSSVLPTVDTQERGLTEVERLGCIFADT